MNICPNCFEELEESRLLYELYFYEGYGLSTIMDKVAGGSDIVKVIAKERDDILYERYLDETIHYHIGRDDGYTIEAFREMICHIREDYLEARKRATEYLAGASGEDAKQKLTQSGLAVLELGDAKEDRSITMYIRHNNGFRDEIARLLPCCPNCHKSLQLYWYEADCFEAVAIIAQKAASKTTMIVSLLANQCSALRFLDEELQVLPAHDPQKDPFYKGLEEQSRLLEEKGYCPDASKTKMLAPLFLFIKYRGKKMILGIYDIAGEVIEQFSHLDYRTKYISRMGSYIYLVDMEKNCGHSQGREEEIRLLDLEQQGEYQISGRVITAEELLEGSSGMHMHRESLDLYQKLKNYMSLNHQLDALKDKHLMLTIAKSDVLEKEEELTEIEQRYLLMRKMNHFQAVQNRILEPIVKKVFLRYVTDEARLEECKSTFGKVSFHAVSATGCATTMQEIEGKKCYVLNKPYNPIRIAEPFVMAILESLNEDRGNVK